MKENLKQTFYALVKKTIARNWLQFIKAPNGSRVHVRDGLVLMVKINHYNMYRMTTHKQETLPYQLEEF